MRLVFMGTPEFAETVLKAIIASRHVVCAVFTQPDRPKGRGGKLVKSPVKCLAEENGIPVFQPQRIRKESIEDLKGLNADAFVTAAFGQILSQEMLDIPKIGTVNVHASLLPRHRGSAPIAYAIWQGDKETGVTTMLTDAGIDSGDLLLSEATEIRKDETTPELTIRLANIGAKLILKTLDGLEDGSVKPQKQPEDGMTYDKMLTKEMGKVLFTESAEEIERRVRAFTPWPSTYVELESGTVKLCAAKAVNITGSLSAGSIISADVQSGLIIQTGSGAIEITELQMPGGKRMSAKDYMRGHNIKAVWQFKE